jgi:hypothetical protein
MAQQITATARGTEAENESDHTHTSTWDAMWNLETHGDGDRPRIGVEYEQKNGNGTSRYAGEVERVQVCTPEDHTEATEETPEVMFQRDDGQRMYLRGDELHTSNPYASFVGHVRTITTSTTSSVALPEEEEDPVARALCTVEKEVAGLTRPTTRERLDAVVAGKERLADLVGEEEADALGSEFMSAVQDRFDWV